jgi:hypothetical protein
VHLGKYGDIINTLPLACEAAELSGERQPFVVAARYADALDGIPYVEPHVFDGGPGELAGALASAKSRWRRVICPQVHSSGWLPERRHPSFALDQWDRVDPSSVGRWGSVRLWLGKPSQYRPEPGVVALASFSESSPFLFWRELEQLIRDAVPGAQIVRLAEMRLPRVLDFVDIYNRASLLITVDTVHAHLSAASGVPTIVLSADAPSEWHGTPWGPRIFAHCRYSAFASRKAWLARRIKMACGGLPPARPSLEKTERRHGYNMSHVFWGDTLIKSYRFHPVPGDWRTWLAVECNGVTEVTRPSGDFEGCSFEDARLFVFDGAPHASLTIAKSVAGGFRCVQAIARVEQRAGGFALGKIRIVAKAGNSFDGMEKNWVPVAHSSGSLWFINGTFGGEQECIRVENCRAVQTLRCPAIHWPHGAVRGGAVVTDGSRMLRVFHSCPAPGSRERVMGLMECEPEPPFRPVSILAGPIYADELYAPGAPQWTPRCLMPFGATLAGNAVRASVGINDAFCGWIDIREGD